MIHIFIKKFLFFIFIFTFSFGYEKKQSNEKISKLAGYQDFGKIPIQYNARTMPLDTFARINLLNFYGRSSLKGITATQWLLELVYFTDDAFKRKIFREKNSDVLDILGMPYEEGEQHFSFNQLVPSLLNEEMEKKILKLQEKEEETLSLIEKRLVNLYNNAVIYFHISRSFTAYLPDFKINNKQLANKIDLPTNRGVSYYQLLNNLSFIHDEISSVKKINDSKYKKEINRIFAYIQTKKKESNFKSQLAIFPHDLKADTHWHSAWHLFFSKQTDGERQMMKDFHYLSKSIVDDDKEFFQKSIQKFLVNYGSITKKTSLEFFYNKMDFFYKSIIFYILAFILCLFGFIFQKKILGKVAFVSVIVGFILLTAGIVARMIIMSRPPVSTLYESILFVNWVATLSGLILELKRKDLIPLLTVTIIGCLSHFVGFRYALEGDTLPSLVAVLNSNFWLATHVVTITIGYGCTLLTGTIAHLLLFFQAKKDYRKKSHNLYKSLFAMTLISLFFTTLGTILGGIWADQSWGRFWGWDPKENGALLIVLWLVLVMHAKISGVINENIFAIGLVLANITVILAWFGVNLLNVGLHSYGFTENIFFGIFAFSTFEVFYCIILQFFISRKEILEKVNS